jgi:predicted LPLAT superfamily acyltransferase
MSDRRPDVLTGNRGFFTEDGESAAIKLQKQLEENQWVRVAVDRPSNASSVPVASLGFAGAATSSSIFSEQPN